MIAEIPASACTAGTGHEEQYRRGRTIVRTTPLGSEIELVGVGFFDFIHDQSGGARNGIELHPVLRVRLLEIKKSPQKDPEKLSGVRRDPSHPEVVNIKYAAHKRVLAEGFIKGPERPNRLCRNKPLCLILAGQESFWMRRVVILIASKAGRDLLSRLPPARAFGWNREPPGA
jgi:hypothetical protein